MRATDSMVFRHIGSGTTPQFTLSGGIYQIIGVGFTSGGATFSTLGPDGSTWIDMLGPITMDGGDTIYCQPGQYAWTITGEADVSLSVVRVPGE